MASPHEVRVLIADEQPAARSALRRLLARNGFTVCAEAGDADTAVREALDHRPEILVVDVLLPGGGVRAISTVAAALPGATVVVLTASRDPDHVRDALREGAVGYLLKDMNSERIPNALRGVLGGETAIPRSLLRDLLSDYRSQGRRRSLRVDGRTIELTPREWQVSRLLRDRLTTAQIAQRLLLSPVTVRRHVGGLVDKLGAESREQAIGLLDRVDL